MKYTKLGKTDINVSVMALGCWPFGGIETWGDQDDADSIETVHVALDSGIILFDTAAAYGRSEEVLGRALKGRRDEAVIATKLGGSQLVGDNLVRACERSLQNLQTNWIDLYQIHWPNWKVPISETMEALERLKEQGKVRAIGVCNFAKKDLTDLLAIGHIETNQWPFSLMWRCVEREVQPICLENGIGIICYSPLYQGLLTGRYASVDEVPDGLSRTRLYSSGRPNAEHSDTGAEEEAFAALDQIRSISERLGEPMANVSLAWVRQQPGVTAMLVGARNPDELKRNLPTVDFVLSKEVIQGLNDATEAVKAKIGANGDMWFSESRMR